ncbi:MAG: hypothetical protein M3320_07220, partial [Actinomycetota bacterium]|nr:hypothetical protein [Actinomycetota bacterium]
MARRSLRPHLNQIRSWVRQGRTDAWIAHQLEVTVQQIQSFKRENELAPETDAAETAAGTDFDDEIDLRAEDDAAIAAEGWGGDEYVVIGSGDQSALVWKSAWDSEADADEFFAALAQHELRRFDSRPASRDDGVI